jgi:hypothetical protein
MVALLPPFNSASADGLQNGASISLAEAQKRAEPAKNDPSAAEHSGKAWFFPLSGEQCLFLGHGLIGSERV